MHYETSWCNSKIWQHSVGQTICMLYASMLHIQSGRCSVKTDVFYSAWECGPDGIFTSISLTFWVLLWPPSLLITSSSRSSGSILRISFWTAWMLYWCGSLVRVAVWPFKWLVCTLKIIMIISEGVDVSVPDEMMISYHPWIMSCKVAFIPNTVCWILFRLIQCSFHMRTLFDAFARMKCPSMPWSRFTMLSQNTSILRGVCVICMMFSNTSTDGWVSSRFL